MISSPADAPLILLQCGRELFFPFFFLRAARAFSHVLAASLGNADGWALRQCARAHKHPRPVLIRIHNPSVTAAARREHSNRKKKEKKKENTLSSSARFDWSQARQFFFPPSSSSLPLFLPPFITATPLTQSCSPPPSSFWK